MNIKTNHKLAVLTLAIASLCLPMTASADRGYPGGPQEAFGPLYQADESTESRYTKPPQNRVSEEDWLRTWNRTALDASGLDHTKPAPGDTRIFGQQLGPVRAIRAIAIVQIAVFDAINAIEGKYKNYTGLPRIHGDASIKAAISQASHDTLVALFSSQAAAFDAQLADDLRHLNNNQSTRNGLELGRRAAARILGLRANDGAQFAEQKLGVDFFPSNAPGKWRQDPISQYTVALGSRWNEVKPFVMTSSSQFRLPPPPALNSPEYTAAFEEVLRLGGDGVITTTERTPDQTNAGIYWAYDGMPSLCAPPRLYNQILVKIATQKHTKVIEFARLLAIANIAMADEGIASWESKYFYQYWRPVGGIREADTDGNPATIADPNYSPLGGQASNTFGLNFTPPFPAYPSGHAGFGGALFQTLRNFYKTDNIPFTFVSDELDGKTKDADGNLRPLAPRSFSTLSQAEEENGQSRIYLGIHWSFDKTSGISQGHKVADLVYRNVYTKVRGRDRDDD